MMYRGKRTRLMQFMWTVYTLYYAVILLYTLPFNCVLAASLKLLRKLGKPIRTFLHYLGYCIGQDATFCTVGKSQDAIHFRITVFDRTKFPNLNLENPQSFFLLPRENHQFHSILLFSNPLKIQKFNQIKPFG